MADQEQEQNISIETCQEDNLEYLHVLYMKEKPLESLASIEEWLQNARLEAISWILKTRDVLGFRFHTAYLSVAYFDQFILRRSIGRDNNWAFQLLAVACLTVAAKMEECIVPPLPEFFIEGDNGIYRFESNLVQRMELLVLSQLEWNMRLVTPFAYINSLVVKFSEDQSSVISRCLQIILASMRDVNLMSYRPSVIAQAAILVALDSKLTVPDLELKIRAHSPFSSSENLKVPDIVSCYNQMKELGTTENVTLLENSSPRGCEEKERFETSVIAGLNNKRKRLVYNDCDQDYGIPDEKRRG